MKFADKTGYNNNWKTLSCLLFIIIAFLLNSCSDNNGEKIAVFNQIKIQVKAFKNEQEITEVNSGDEIVLSVVEINAPNETIYTWEQLSGETITITKATDTTTNPFTIPNTAQSFKFKVTAQKDSQKGEAIIELNINNPIIVIFSNFTKILVNDINTEIQFSLAYPEDVTPQIVSIISSNQDVINDFSLSTSLTAGDGMITIQECAGIGSTELTIEIDNGFGETITASHSVTVFETGSKPVISGAADISFNEDTNGVVNFTITDNVTPVEELIIEISSDNQTLLPDENLTLSGTDGNKTLTLTPAENENGTATITIIVTDGDQFSTETSFVATVNSVNDEPSATKGNDLTISEDSGEQIIENWATNINAGPDNESEQTVNFNVLAVNSELFTVQPAISPEGTLTFTPAENKNGSTAVTFTVEDSEGASNTEESFNITITPVNDQPTVTDTSFSMEGTDVTLTGSLLGTENDVDEGDSLIFAVVNGANGTNGTVVIEENGDFTYTRSGDWAVNDSFQFHVWDGTIWSEPATAIITVDYSTPIANNQSVTISDVVTERSILITLTALSNNPLTFIEYTSPEKGMLSGTWPDITYTILEGTYPIGVDTFEFKVTDGQTESNIATVTINLEGNDCTGTVDIGSNQIASIDLFLFVQGELSYSEYLIQIEHAENSQYISNFNFIGISTLVEDNDYGIKFVPKDEFGNVITTLNSLTVTLTGTDSSTVTLNDTDFSFVNNDGQYFLTDKQLRVLSGSVSIITP